MAEYELAYLRNCVPLLENYLLSEEIYWQLGAGPPTGAAPFPSFTLGGVLLLRAKAAARHLTAAQQDELERLNHLIDACRGHWRVAWSRKAGREHRARLGLWRMYLEEYFEQPDANIDRYPYEVNRRVQVHLLAAEADRVPRSDAELMASLDRRLHAVFVPGAFVWEMDLARGFPTGVYWYLWGHPEKID